MKSKTLWMLGLLLAGCYEDQPDPLPYPPLDARALVGCWTEAQGTPYCNTYCFDRGRGYFMSMTFTTRGKEIGEDSGIFTLEGNQLNLSTQLRTTADKDQQRHYTLSLTLINDTLFSTAPFRGASLTRVHPDSFPCGLKPWTLFQKPPGWDSLIIPYDR